MVMVLLVPDATVYSSENAVHHAEEKSVAPTCAIPFTKVSGQVVVTVAVVPT